MTIADDLGFDKSSIGYTVLSSRYEDMRGIDDGDRVSLKYKDEPILIRDVSYEDGGIYWGLVHSFDRSGGVCFEELERDQHITFREEHVFSCTRTVKSTN